jgi:dihydrofolate reductase
MGKVVVAMSMSLDGFITGANDSTDFPMGIGGEQLHEWMFKGEGVEVHESYKTDTTNAEIVKDYFSSTGAFLMGRRWFDMGEEPWGKDPPFKMPVFVVTHRKHEKIIKGKTTFNFVTDGLEAAVRAAKDAAGDKNVIAGAASISQQLLQAGLLDEILISIVPILLGSGRPLFDQAMHKQVELERIKVIEAPGVTHIRYRVVK